MLLPWLFPQTKRNNFAAKVNSENQEKLLILRKEDASASSGQSELSLVQMGLKQVVASSFWLVFEFQHFKVGCNAARKFPVNGIANAQPQQCGTYRSHNGKLSIAIGHFCRIHQRAHTHFAIAKIAELNPAVHCHHVVWHLFWRTHLGAIQLCV